MKSDERFRLSPEEMELVEANKNLVAWIVHHRIGWASEQEFCDRVQVGTIGLIKAVKTFDESKKKKFVTYASTCIMNEILMDIRKNKKALSEVSLNAPIYEDKGGNLLVLGDTLEDKRSSDRERDMETREILEKALMVILNCFSPQKRNIILLGAAGVTQAKIANLLKVSQSCVSRLRCKYQKELITLLKNYRENKSKTHLKVNVQQTTIRICFYITDIGESEQDLDRTLLKIQEQREITNFRLSRRGEQITICLPLESESLRILAILINDIETFQKKYRRGFCGL